MGEMTTLTKICVFYSGITHWKCTVIKALDDNNNRLTRQMLEILSDHENAKRKEAANNCMLIFLDFISSSNNKPSVSN